jgi:hypothetical protein
LIRELWDAYCGQLHIVNQKLHIAMYFCKKLIN